jgi:hypothetical protein
MTEPEDRQDLRIVAAQALRDRDRLRRAEAEILALQQRVALLERSSPLGAVLAARKLARRLPARLRRVAARLLRERGAPVEGKAPPPVALVIDDHLPQPDRDAGSMEILNLLLALRDFGFEVVFAAAREIGAASPAADRLRQEGITLVAPPQAGSVEDFLARHGATIDLCVLCRVYCGGNYLEAVQRHCRRARIVFNVIDLHFLREERRLTLSADPAQIQAVRDLRRREETIIRASDATMVVSRAELDLLTETMPEAYVVEMPLARPLTPPRTGFAERQGIGFIGGFAHAPNIDAVRHFLDDIWPLLQREMPEIAFSIVGADFPAALLEGRPGRIRALGHLPDIGPWFESLRLTVAPLRFGAGAKGKVASSLAAGVPCIATPIAAEGMSLTGDSGVLVAEDPAAFVACIRRVHDDPALWALMSAAGQAYAAQVLSPGGWRARLARMLQAIGFPDAAR